MQAEKLKPTIRYWMETEVHVYGFSVAANVLLSFFPFLIVMVALCRFVLEWRGAEQAIYLALSDYFPDDFGDFLVRNLKATAYRRGPLQVASILLLLFTANGVFEPMEVALNRVWGATRNRSFFRNQLLSLGLIFACGALALFSMVLTAVNQQFLRNLLGADFPLMSWLGVLFFKLAAIPISILMLFLIYWILPNVSVPWRRVVPVAVAVGLLLEGLKWINLLLWPWMRAKLSAEYGPFRYSAAILLLSFLASMLVLGGAEWAARRGIGPVPEAGGESSG